MGTLNHCYKTFVAFGRCLEENKDRSEFVCRLEQRDFDKCMSAAGQEKALLMNPETVIQDEQVPWKKVLNPLDFKIPHYPKEKIVDSLADFNIAPENQAFKDFIERDKKLNPQKYGNDAQ